MTLPPEESRRAFLFQMYNQLFNDINRHILVVWQSVSVLIGSIALLGLSAKGVLSPEIATTLVVLVCAWLLAHTYDASLWYNRNLAMIANIERQFLVQSDLRDIHYYFGKHRPANNPMISHLKNQFALGVGLGACVLLYHFITEVVPGAFAANWTFAPDLALPYVAAIVAAGYLYCLSSRLDEAYAEFLSNSPGIAIETPNVTYGIGHGFGKGGCFTRVSQWWHERGGKGEK